MTANGLDKAGLARLLVVTGGTITKMLRGEPRRRGPNASMELLGDLLAKLTDLGLPRLFPQGDLFEIDPTFLDDAKKVLESLRKDAGDVEGDHPVTAFVGLQFHGPPPERRAIERRFLVRLKRKAPM